MKKFLLYFLIITGISMGAFSQSIDNKFFTKVSYIGAFDGINDWTEGWTEWNPVFKDYPIPSITKGNGIFTRTGGTHITANETWSGVIKLDGWVYVDAGATLTIQPGTIIRGTTKSVLVIDRGGKINAVGTKTSPIVMTSSQGVNFRSQSDWAGLVLCGKAPNNEPGGEGVAEGGIGSPYGGTDPADSSGVIKYLRIEFPGYEVATGSEVNGLTFYSVGNKTSVDYVQVSYSGDDAFEWFGGTVNVKHIVSFRTEDDDFDTDNGFSGMVQFCVALRDPNIVDTDTANGFESDNDKSGSNATPLTTGIFSNITAVGPAKDQATYNALPTNHKEGSAMRLRRNTRLSSYNSIWMAYGRGVRLESSGSQNATATDALTVKNSIIAGIFGNNYMTDNAAMSAAQLEAWFLTPSRKNQFLVNASDLKLRDPFNLVGPSFQPMLGSPVFNASYWYNSQEPVSINNSFFEKVSYIGAFNGTDDWTAGWAEWDPFNKNYPATTTTKGNGIFTRAGGLHITADETWSGVIKLDGWVYVDAGATLTIQPGTIIRGTNKSVLVIDRGGKIYAVGTKSSPIVFTSNQGAGFRAQSDWAGLVLCGKAPNNEPGGEGVAEGGIGSPYGGSDPMDNSGILAYVRIEFPGYEVATGSEVNGLTFYSVGNKTSVDYIQVSYSGDDAFEWFGGTVNVKHIISYRTEDDDFDTDNGFSGMVQFCVALRDPNIVDTDTANGFESDNDKSGSNATPPTSGIFSNITAVGPAKDQATYNALPTNHKEGSAMRLRRNTRLSSYNSVWMAYGRGIRLESAGSQNATATDALTIKNSIIAGIFGNNYMTDNAAMSAAQLQSWYLASDRKNQFLENASDVKLKDPFNLTSPDFQPMSGSPVFNASIWITTSVSDLKKPSLGDILVRNYPNPFKGTTTIELTLEKNSDISMTVFNMTGSVVANLHNGHLNQGTYHFQFDGTGLPKGIYPGKITVDNTNYFLKMIIE